MDNLALLKPKVRSLAAELINECAKRGIIISVTCGFRSSAAQDRLYEAGRRKPGKIVTNAKGGFSFHNYGVAFDFCPIVAGRPDWKDLALFRKVGKIGESLGLEWGGSWKGFKDLPHFQYTAGYTIGEFRKRKVDWNRFQNHKSQAPNNK